MRALPLLFVLALAACGEVEPVERPLPEGLLLPTTSVVGDLPSSFGRVDVTITVDGDLDVNGRACEFEALSAALVEASGGLSEPRRDTPEEIDEDIEEVPEQEILAEEPVVKEDELVEGPAGPPVLAARDPAPRLAPTFEPDGARSADLLLRVDERVPWRMVGHVMMAAAHPDVKLYRFFVAVRDADGAVGAIATFLPKDKGLCGDRVEVEWARAVVRLRSGKAPRGAFAPESVELLARELGKFVLVPDMPLSVSVDGHVDAPWGACVAVLDAAVRAGAHTFFYEGFRAESSPAVEPSAAAQSFHAVVIDRSERGRRPFGRPVRAGRVQGLFGISNEASMAFEEEIEEEPDEDGEAVVEDPIVKDASGGGASRDPGAAKAAGK